MAYFSDVLSPCLCAGCWSTGGGAGNGLNAFTLHSFAFLPICSHIKFNHFRPSSFQGNFHCYYKLHRIIVIYSISTILRALLPSGAFYFEVFSMGDETEKNLSRVVLVWSARFVSNGNNKSTKCFLIFTSISTTLNTSLSCVFFSSFTTKLSRSTLEPRMMPRDEEMQFRNCHGFANKMFFKPAREYA